MNQGVTRSEHVISTNIGETVTLECVALLTFFSLSTWRQNGTAIFIGTNLNPQFTKGSRFHLTGNHTIGEYFLRINDVTEDDLGIYWCETRDNHGAVQREITLSLRSTTKIRTFWFNQIMWKKLTHVWCNCTYTANIYSQKQTRIQFVQFKLIWPFSKLAVAITLCLSSTALTISSNTLSSETETAWLNSMKVKCGYLLPKAYASFLICSKTWLLLLE